MGQPIWVGPCFSTVLLEFTLILNKIFFFRSKIVRLYQKRFSRQWHLNDTFGPLQKKQKITFELTHKNEVKMGLILRNPFKPYPKEKPREP
jgi:hypothetical protein